MGRFESKVVIVTGAGAGIGKAAAIRFAAEGANVVVANRTPATGEETVTTIREAGGEAIFVKTDVAVADDVKKMVDRCVQRFGKLDIAFNNAGVTGTQFIPTAQYSEEDWDYVLNINLKGAWLCHKYQIPAMLAYGGGVIVNNSSVSGLIAPAHGSHYAASKHGLIGLTKAAAIEYAKEDIRVNAVCPAVTKTDMADFLNDPALVEKVTAMHPIGRFGEPEEVVNAVLWLSSDEASFTTGVALPVDGGFTAGR